MTQKTNRQTKIKNVVEVAAACILKLYRIADPTEKIEFDMIDVKSSKKLKVTIQEMK